MSERLQELERMHAEWRPWLAVVATVLPELVHPRWDAAAAGVAATGLPPAAGVCPCVDAAAVNELYAKLRRAALRSQLPALLAWNEQLSSVEIMQLFAATLHEDAAALGTLARRAEVEAEAFAAVAALLPMPLLHACRRACATPLRHEGSDGRCPVCAAWPAFAEVCGIERTRYLRCGRCGAAWDSLCLRCVYCGTSEHARLGSLLAAAPEQPTSVEVCMACRGYLKVRQALALTAPADVLLEDLASVDFDVAAAARDYRRPGRAADASAGS